MEFVATQGEQQQTERDTNVQFVTGNNGFDNVKIYSAVITKYWEIKWLTQLTYSC